MSKLHIADNLSLPLDAVTQTFGILAMRGAGKTNTGRVMAEEMFKHKLPFVAIDPIGSWWGLRSSRDGNGPGLPIPIFGGRHGDVPLEKHSGKLMAELIAQKRLSCVLDVSEFEFESDKKQFLLDFALKLFKVNEDPLHLFLEESDDYIPQKPMGKIEPWLLRAWENIVKRGRSRGLGITAISQRSAAINKNVLTQIGTLIAMRITSPQDRDAVKEWVKYHRQSEELLESLSTLQDGEAWVWSPQFLKKVQRVRFRLSNTFDSGATPTNVTASSKRAPATMADIDLDVIKTRMAETIERAKAEDPRELRKRIQELEKKLKEGSAALLHLVHTGGKGGELTAEKRAELRQKGAQAERVRIRRDLDPLLKLLSKNLAKALPVKVAISTEIQTYRADLGGETLLALQEDIARVGETLAKTAPVPEASAADELKYNYSATLQPPSSDLQWNPSKSPKSPRAPRERLAVSGGSNHQVGAGVRKILTAVAQYENGVTREQLSVLTGYKRSSRDTYLQRLRERDLIEVGPDRILATDAGRDMLGSDFEPLPTGSALRAYWLERLPEGERRILEVLLHARGHPIARESIDDETQYKRSSRDTYLQRLRARELVEFTGRGEVSASAELFDEI